MSEVTSRQAKTENTGTSTEETRKEPKGTPETPRHQRENNDKSDRIRNSELH